MASERYAHAAGAYASEGYSVFGDLDNGGPGESAATRKEIPALKQYSDFVLNKIQMKVWVDLSDGGDSKLIHDLIYAQVKSTVSVVGSVSAINTPEGIDALQQSVHEISVAKSLGKTIKEFLLDESGSLKTYEIFGNLDAKSIATSAGLVFATAEFVQALDDLAEAAEQGGTEGFLEELETQAIYWGAGFVIAVVGVALLPELAVAAGIGLSVVSVADLIGQVIDGVPGDPISDLGDNVQTIISTLIDVYHEGANDSLPPVPQPDPVPSQVTLQPIVGDVYRGFYRDDDIDLNIIPEQAFGAVFGGGGDDRIVGTDATENLYGGIGDDDIEGGGGNDLILGDDLSDETDGGRDVLHGGAGDDQIDGGKNDDSIYGDEGNDLLIGGGGGVDVIDGGNTEAQERNLPYADGDRQVLAIKDDGIDTADYAGAGNGIEIRIDSSYSERNSIKIIDDGDGAPAAGRCRRPSPLSPRTPRTGRRPRRESRFPGPAATREIRRARSAVTAATPPRPIKSEAYRPCPPSRCNSTLIQHL